MAPSPAKSRKTWPAIEEELTETVPEFVLFAGTSSSEEVEMVAVLVKTCGSDADRNDLDRDGDLGRAAQARRCRDRR
jgi:hypothetical protein